jgi:hypothetical protein
MSPVSKPGMSLSPLVHAGWEGRCELGDDERTRPAADRGAGRGDAGPTRPRLGRHGAGTEHARGRCTGCSSATVSTAPAAWSTGHVAGRRTTGSTMPCGSMRSSELVRTSYPDFGPTLAAEMLAEKHGLMVSRETLRTWMTAAGLWLSRPSAAPPPASAEAASGMPGRARSDRRQRAPLVRGSCRSVHLARVHRRWMPPAV